MRRILQWAAAACLLAAAQAALAQDEKERPKRADPAELFSRLDKNGDGTVTEDEVGEDRKSYFERLVRAGDKNKDGKLTKDEFSEALAAERKRPKATSDEKQPQPKQFNPEAFFDRLDRNGDGKIGKDEMPEQGREFIERLDANKDGEITKEEFRAAAAKFRPKEQPRPTAAGGE